MKRFCQALCPKCGRVWTAITQDVINNRENCPSKCGAAIIRFNPPIGKGILE